ncbi:MAG: Restriction endonuclease [Candidatus Gottesmanbacteria bacterium GW2011_GWB1_43_11]|uniref:Restriction endonuclease n=1 Tax=Candidatus Gottesmanbacteria bacterium GW2011_GWB1_43_11 TaxID=1618446 RepID=A0A0G1EUX3_9BACT|nr:MAG: Restriction endonuclease [Candidatus Gottesmanbacteria bacterium GW2011_GWA2_42_16]KKS55383.1 MAG: Restriction endonuclease [Candidatus Gottesmanbacteria bacterium GW2011_GWA1_42_26]KKS81916.1 MAG: Restriction endonuclease [Candidatus Gottesmanbacteria bacterium GW2011_GWC1_43_10]KKS86836.1 MAG: Restriction endonuclease [Candidatus Gottesmanbacteria bacterium GW2011_GWB1_43_11]OGG10509.1 MAG: hypothetical protein A2699_04005 [Candidatus Gottesmanbacteria bacterium RIFCSPHIGHO2_01_FULL_4
MASKHYSEDNLYKLVSNYIVPGYFDRFISYNSYISIIFLPITIPLSLIESIFSGAELKEKRNVAIDKIKKGDEEALTKLFLYIFNESIKFKSNFNASIAINAKLKINNPQALTVNINLPPKDFIPKNKYKILKSGEKSYSEKSRTQINEEYKDLITLICYRILHALISYLPSIHKIYLNGYAETIHKTKGHRFNACLLSCVVDIDEYDQIIVENLEPEAILSNFNLRFNYDRDYEISETTPHLYDESVVDRLIDLDTINPFTFEELISSLLNKMGLVAVTTQHSYDGGIDVIAENSNPIIGGRFVIQCKRYQNVVPVDIIRDLYGAMTHERASKGILITTSDFSNECVKFAQGKPIELINRKKLTQLLEDNKYKVAQKI